VPADVVAEMGSGLTHTVIGATDAGAWPLSRLLNEALGLA